MLWDDRIGRRLRLKDLHTLQTVAEVGSMAKASELLALSQPAISKAIADMEHTLGAPLLDRTSRGVELTDCGRALVERARVIFDEIRLGVKEIEHWTDPTQGEVRNRHDRARQRYCLGDHLPTCAQAPAHHLSRVGQRHRHVGAGIAGAHARCAPDRLVHIARCRRSGSRGSCIMRRSQ